MRYADADALLLDLAHRQHGVVARWQLLPAGVPAILIDERVRRRRLERIARCVYRIPGLDGPRQCIAATVLSFGAHAAASHGSAAEVLDIVVQPAGEPAVSVGRGHPNPRNGVRLYRVKLGSDERSVCDGVPVTSAARTLLDLASLLPDRAIEQALARSLRLGIVTGDDVSALIQRYPGRPGTRILGTLLGADTQPALTRSEAEERFLALVRRAGLPEPRVNTMVHGLEVDFLWHAQAMAVEIDGLAYHSSRAAQQRDRERDSRLAASGLRVLRFTWADLTARPERTLARVALALGRSGV